MSNPFYQVGIGAMWGVPNGGNASTPSYPQRFLTLQNVDVEISQKLIDLRGQNKFPDDTAPGEMDMTGKSGFGRVEVDIFNALYFGDSVTTGTKQMNQDEAQTINALGAILTVAVHSGAGGTGYQVGDVVAPTGVSGSAATFRVSAASGGVVSALTIITEGSGYSTGTNVATAAVSGIGTTLAIDFTVSATSNTFTVNNAAYFLQDLGVLKASDSSPFQSIGTSGTPAQGQYKVSSGGLYTFNSGDSGTACLASYTSTSSSGKTLVVNNHIIGYGPTFELWLFEPYTGANGIHLFKCRSSKMSNPLKRDNYLIPDFEFKAYPNSSGQVFEYFQVSV